MSTASSRSIRHREAGPNFGSIATDGQLDQLTSYALRPEVLESEESVGRAMLAELEALRLPKAETWSSSC